MQLDLARAGLLRVSNGNGNGNGNSKEKEDDIDTSNAYTEDPYYRYTEREWQWTADVCWRYDLQISQAVLTRLKTTTLTQQQQQQQQQQQYWAIRFESVDTVARVLWNGRPLPTTFRIGGDEDSQQPQLANMFRPHYLPLPSSLHLPQSELVEGGQQTLSVEIVSPRAVATTRAKAYPYPVPESEYSKDDVWTPANRNFVRKTVMCPHTWFSIPLSISLFLYFPIPTFCGLPSITSLSFTTMCMCSVMSSSSSSPSSSFFLLSSSTVSNSTLNSSLYIVHCTF